VVTIIADDEEYNSILHGLLDLSLILIHINGKKDDEMLQKGLLLLGDVRERMLEIVANSD
jgi:hypothetical protein